jgi:hypothetical protein
MFKSIKFVLVLFAVLIAFSCEKKDDAVIDPSYDSPVIISVTKSTDTVSTSSGAPLISFDLSAVVSENGGGGIAGVDCKLVDPLGSVVSTFSLSYAGDVGADKKYSKSVSAGGISCLLVGTYSVQLIAKSDAGLFSSQVNSPLIVRDLGNVAPVITGTTLPDSVTRPLSGQFDLTISINVTDADGSCDIGSVYFDAYRPTGSYIGVIPMTLFSGSEWRFTNPVLPDTSSSTYGYYRYRFFARDRSEAVSIGVWDSIKFVRP